MTEPASSNYPTSLDDSTSLGGDVVNFASFTLDTGINTSTGTISVAESISGINVPCYLLIGSELVWATTTNSGDFTNCDRGAGNTSAASHLSGDTVYAVYGANSFNQLKRAIIAIETELGAAVSGSFATVLARLQDIESDISTNTTNIATNTTNISTNTTDISTINTRIAKSLNTSGYLDFTTSTELTISSDSITPTQNWHTVDTESDAASDNLATIATTNVSDGFILILRANNAARTVVLKHGTGNIQCANATDISLDETRKFCVCIYDATLAAWLVALEGTPKAVLSSSSPRVYTSGATWTKPSTLLYAVVEVIGGGGAGGGAASTSGTTYSAGGGGGGGGYSRKRIDAASLGSTETVTVGAAGAGASGADGGAGGTSSFGSHLQATGGTGGVTLAAFSTTGVGGGVDGGIGSSGNINSAGGVGAGAFRNLGTLCVGGLGGGSHMGGGGSCAVTIASATSTGTVGKAYGGGGGGSANGNSQSAVAGGAGAAGVVIVWEYLEA